MTGPITLVSVVFESELEYQWLQATSMVRYVDPDLVAEIIVLDNSSRGMSRRHRTHLLDGYGPGLQPLVRIVRAGDVCSVPRALGWLSQQVLKLEVARSVSTDRYLLLDAKNHFVTRLTAEFLEAPDGRPRCNAYSYRDHPLRPGLERVLRYLDLQPDPFLDWFPATVTPFVMDTGVVRGMITALEARSGRTFAEEFVRQDLLEFFLYSGWIVATGSTLSDHFDFHQRFSPNVWPRGANLETVRRAVDAAHENGSPIFSVHRKALAALGEEALDVLSAFWLERDLFADQREVERFLRRFRIAYGYWERRRKLRELPYRLQRAVRRKVQA